MFTPTEDHSIFDVEEGREEEGISAADILECCL